MSRDMYVELGTAPCKVGRDVAMNPFTLEGKRGDDTTRNVYFLLLGQRVDAPATAFQLELKNYQDFENATPLVRVVDFTVVSDSAGDYLTFEESWDSTEVSAYFTANAGTKLGSVLECMGELTWETPAGKVSSTKIFTTKIFNDVNKIWGSANPLPPSLTLSGQITSYNGNPVTGFAGGSLNDLLDFLGQHGDRTDNPHSVTKTQVGLGNVPNVDATNAANITSGELGSTRLSGDRGAYRINTYTTKGKVEQAGSDKTLIELCYDHWYKSDRLMLVPPSAVEYSTDGMNWFDAGFTSTQLKNIMLGRFNSSFISTDPSWTHIRFQYDYADYPRGLYSLNTLFFFSAERGEEIQGVEIEAYSIGGAQWKSIDSDLTADVSGWPTIKRYEHSRLNIYSSGASRYSSVRCVFHLNAGRTQPWDLHNIVWYGDHPAGLVNPVYDWDRDGNMSVRNGLDVADYLQVTGAADFDADVTHGDQDLSNPEASVNVGMLQEWVMMNPSLNLKLGCDNVAASGTGSVATINLPTLGGCYLKSGTVAGAYAHARFAHDLTAYGLSGSALHFSAYLDFSGMFRIALTNDAEGVIRFMVGHHEVNAPALADSDAWAGGVDFGVGFEISYAQHATNKSVRIIYHDGTTYKFSSWYDFSVSDPNQMNYPFRFINRGNGNIELYMTDSAGLGKGALSMAGLAPILQVGDGPTGALSNNYGGVVLAAVNDSTSYTNRVECQMHPINFIHK